MRQNWEIVSLKEILTERQEIPSNESIFSGEILIIEKISFKQGKIQIRTGKTTKTGMILIQPGDLVISGINAAKGAIAIYAKENTKPIAATIHYGAYILNQERADIQYLWLFLRSRTFQDLLLQYVPGGIKTELKAKRLLPIPIPLPPLDEQQRIVARIQELDGKVEEARGLRRQSVEEAEALFCSGIERVITILAETSEDQQLINLVERERGISYGVVLTGTPQLQEDGVPTLRAGNLQKFQIILDNIKYITPEIEAKYQRTRLRGNELLLRIRGGLGELAVCPSEMIGGNVSREIAVIPFAEKVLPKYGMYVLSAPCNQIKMKAHLRGTSYVGINLKDVRMLSIPVPPSSNNAVLLPISIICKPK